MQQLPSDTTIIHGTNGKVDNQGRVIRGADKMAAECALELGLAIDKPPTKNNQWGGYPYLGQFGLAGGAIRNTQMLNEGQPNEIWCFHNQLTNSRGSLNMVDQARRAGLPVKLFTEDWPDGAYLELDQRAVPKAVQDMLYEDAITNFIVSQMGLPQHHGTCDCESCNEAYGKRRQL